VLEKKDMIKRIECINSYFPNGKIVLYGMSMGAATVMQAADTDLTENAVGIIEDCGFTSAWEEFGFVLKTQAHLPSFPLLHILNILCRLFLNFDLKSSDSRKSLAKTKLPVLFIHGNADVFVPEFMAHECFDACNSEKEIKIYDGAAHAQSHFMHKEKYENDFLTFADKCFKQ
jgi:fermentation-respiration switch protein FrsA (DUF1100 family)